MLRPIRTLFLFFLLLALTIAACGTGDDEKDKDEQTENESSGAVPLAETFTGENGLNVNYPEGWLVRGDRNYITLDTSEGVWVTDADGETTGVASGQFTMLIFPPLPRSILPYSPDPTSGAALRSRFDPSPFPRTTLEVDGDALIEEVVSAHVRGLEPEADGGTVGKTTTTTIGGKDAARVSATLPGTDGVVFAFNLDDEIVVLGSFAAHEGELEDFEATAIAILESVTYSALEE